MRQCPQCSARYDDAIAFCPADGVKTELPTAEQDPLIGTVIDGRYRIDRRIGEGGMGVVYRATHAVLKKPFALKLIRGEQASDARVVERFMREARAASAIGHPNIVNINDFGTAADGTVYLAMEFLHGKTLAEAMQQAPIAYDRALSIFVQIAGALEAAHAQGIVHRDLKPENIFLVREPDQNDFVKVLDFGIAKVKNAAAKLTHTGLVFGTPNYMSPEQAAGQPVDHRSDIYSFGVIMYQVLSGRLPFTAESQMALVTKHLFEPPPSLRAQGCAVPSVLDAIVTRCLQKKPEQRQGSMRELENELRRVQVSPVSEPRPPAPVASASFASSLTAAAPSGSYSATSELLDAAMLAHDPSFDEDGDPITVPKQRPVWLWGLAIGAVLLLLMLSLGGPGSQRASAPSEPASGAARKAPVLESSGVGQVDGGHTLSREELRELPRGVAEPATPEVENGRALSNTEPALPAGLEAPAPERAQVPSEPEPARKPERAAAAVQPVRPSGQGVPRQAQRAAPTKPTTTQRPPQAGPSAKTTPRQSDSVLDPWQ